jgi:hypothetical protein
LKLLTQTKIKIQKNNSLNNKRISAAINRYTDNRSESESSFVNNTSIPQSCSQNPVANMTYQVAYQNQNNFLEYKNIPVHNSSMSRNNMMEGSSERQK